MTIANFVVLLQDSYVLVVHPHSPGCLTVRQEEANEVVEGLWLRTSCRQIKAQL